MTSNTDKAIGTVGTVAGAGALAATAKSGYHAVAGKAHETAAKRQASKHRKPAKTSEALKEKMKLRDKAMENKVKASVHKSKVKPAGKAATVAAGVSAASAGYLGLKKALEKKAEKKKTNAGDVVKNVGSVASLGYSIGSGMDAGTAIDQKVGAHSSSTHKANRHTHNQLAKNHGIRGLKRAAKATVATVIGQQGAKYSKKKNLEKKASDKPTHVCTDGLVYYKGKNHRGDKAGANAVDIKSSEHHNKQIEYHRKMQQAHVWAHGHSIGLYD